MDRAEEVSSAFASWRVLAGNEEKREMKVGEGRVERVRERERERFKPVTNAPASRIVFLGVV